MKSMWTGSSADRCRLVDDLLMIEECSRPAVPIRCISRVLTDSLWYPACSLRQLDSVW